MADRPEQVLPNRPAGLSELPAYLAGCMEFLVGGQERIEHRLDDTLKTQAAHEGRIQALEARCDERGDDCGRKGIVVSWKVAGLILVAVLVLGAVLGPDAVRAAVAFVK
jgi:hypothetical protein